MTPSYEKPFFSKCQLKIELILESEPKNAKSLCLTAIKDISKQSGGCKALKLLGFVAKEIGKA